jgi:hypothetical protein
MMDSDDSGLEERLRTTFRIYVTLLTLFTAVHNRGSALLSQPFQEGYHPIINTEFPGDQVVADALAGVSIRDYHIVSTAIRKKLPSAPPSLDSHVNSESNVTQPWDEDDLESYDIQQLKFETDRIKGFVVVANAHTSLIPQTSDYVIVSGESHFNLISETHWDCLNIP